MLKIKYPTTNCHNVLKHPESSLCSRVWCFTFSFFSMKLIKDQQMAINHPVNMKIVIILRITQ